MTRLASALSLIALFAGAPAAGQAARDFQLPPAATPTADTRVQGPVDTDAPVPVRPRTIATGRPATPTPTASATPTIVLPQPAPTQAAPASRIPAARSTRSATEPAPVSSAAPLPAATLQPPGAAAPAPSPLPSATIAPAPAAPRTASGGSSLPWLWIALGGLLLAAAAAFAIWRRRASPDPAEILMPAVAMAPEGLTEALALSVEAVRMDRSVLNATVGYRVTLRNRTARALSGLAVEADLVSASRERPVEQQLASPDSALTPRHRAERLAPGQSLRFEGQVRLPLAEAGAIWQGRVGLLVPLLRIRATAADAVPVATTLVIGRAEGQASRPQPFRLDEPPRSYAPLAQRTLDAVPARA